MITSELARLVDAIHAEKNIPRDVVIGIVESAIEAAARKVYGMNRDIEAPVRPRMPARSTSTSTRSSSTSRKKTKARSFSRKRASTTPRFSWATPSASRIDIDVG